MTGKISNLTLSYIIYSQWVHKQSYDWEIPGIYNELVNGCLMIYKPPDITGGPHLVEILGKVCISSCIFSEGG